MAKFFNQLAQPLQLDGDWQIALASISFPSNINNVNSAEIVAYISSGAELDPSHTRTGQLRRIRKGIYNSSEEILEEIFRIAQLKQFYYDFETVTQELILKFGPNEGLSFEDEEVPSILGFEGTKDTSRHGFIPIVCKSENAGNSLTRHFGDFPVDITCGSQLIFVYIDIIEHQNVGDVRAPVIKIIEKHKHSDTHTPQVLHKFGLQANIIKQHSEHPGRVEKQNWKTNSFYWNRKIYSQFKISKKYLIWRHTTAIKHLSQCRIFPDTTDKEAAVLERLLQALEELLCP